MKKKILVGISLVIVLLIGLNFYVQKDVIKLVVDIDENEEENDSIVANAGVVIEKKLEVMGLDSNIVEHVDSNEFKIDLKTDSKEERDKIIQNLIKRDDVQFIALDENTDCKVGDDINSIKGEIVLNGSNIKDASLYVDDNKPYIAISFNADGSEKFRAATEKITLYESGEGQIAVAINGEVKYAPYVNVIISDGKCILTGDFSAEEVSDLACSLIGSQMQVDLKLK